MQKLLQNDCFISAAALSMLSDCAFLSLSDMGMGMGTVVCGDGAEDGDESCGDGRDGYKYMSPCSSLFCMHCSQLIQYGIAIVQS